MICYEPLINLVLSFGFPGLLVYSTENPKKCVEAKYINLFYPVFDLPVGLRLQPTKCVIKVWLPSAACGAVAIIQQNSVGGEPY